MWTVAFLTGVPGGDVVNHLKGDYVSVYVPTTPNPTSGFLLLVPEQATEQHLQLLSELAQMFSNRGFRERLAASEPGCAGLASTVVSAGV